MSYQHTEININFDYIIGKECQPALQGFPVDTPGLKVSSCLHMKNMGISPQMYDLTPGPHVQATRGSRKAVLCILGHFIAVSVVILQFGACTHALLVGL